MPSSVAEAEALFKRGKIEEAEACFISLLKNEPHNKVYLNNLGVIIAGKNQPGQAIKYFSKALEIDPYYLDAIINFCEMLRLAGRLEKGQALLEMAVQKYPDQEAIQQLLNDSRRAGLANNLTRAPLPTVTPGVEGDQVELPEKIMARVAVLTLPGMESFLGDIVTFLDSRCEVRTCYSRDGEEMKAAIEWADVVWVEWANELAVMLTNSLPEGMGKRIICRLHSYEAFAGFISEIKWERIDDLVFVADHIRDHVLARVPDLAERVANLHVIPSGVDLEKYPLIEKQKGKNLAYLGYINYKKGPMLLLQAMAELVRLDSDYRLFIAGKIQDDRYALYFNQMVKEMGLEKNINFDGWIDDVPAWLADKQYIVSSSVLESQGMGIMQAMASGLKPVVHNFVGARGIYDSDHLWNTIPEFVEKILEDDFDSTAYRKFIEENYSLQKQLSRLAGLIRPLENQGPESHCGGGSYLANTSEIRGFLDSVLKRYNIGKMIDVPCGDWNWMRQVDLTGVEYIGYDNDEGFIDDNRRLYPDHQFVAADALNVDWPRADLILCRDFTIHLPDDDIVKLLESFRKSGAKYLLTTSYDYLNENKDFTDQQKKHAYGRHSRPSRLVNLEIDPYRLGPPIESVRENSSVACQNRIVGLWRLN